MYWSDRYLGEINRANLDGNNRQNILSGGGFNLGFALDPVRGKMYWTDERAGKIRRANLDGSEKEDVITGLSDPRGLPPEIGSILFDLTGNRT